MSEYHKINSLFKRDSKTNNLIIGDWAQPEFEYLASNNWEFTEKVDGTNIRVILQNGVITFGGRTDNASLPAPLFARLTALFTPIKDLMTEKFPEGVVLYGEGYGAKIQKVGYLYRDYQDFVLFDVRVGNWWLKRTDVVGVACDLGLDSVPVIGQGTLHTVVKMVAQGIKSVWGDFVAEGIVARPRVELKARDGSRIIAKIKTRDLVKGEHFWCRT